MVFGVQSSLSVKAYHWKSCGYLRMMLVVLCLLVSKLPSTTCHAASQEEATPGRGRAIHNGDSDRGRTLVGISIPGDLSTNDLHLNSYHYHRNDNPDAVDDGFATLGRMSIANMTCEVFQQPLNHFVPRGRSPAYQERYCTYYDYAADGDATAPIFFYTGNESPLEQYINQVGFGVFLGQLRAFDAMLPAKVIVG